VPVSPSTPCEKRQTPSKKGSYSQSTGLDLIRKHTAEYIQRRDCFPCDPESVCLSGGASESIRVCFALLRRFQDFLNVQNVLKLFVHREGGGQRKKAGVLVPIPQYPLYSASIEEFNLGQVGYFLDEQSNWALDMVWHRF
jgi:alanine transaminase